MAKSTLKEPKDLLCLKFLDQALTIRAAQRLKYTMSLMASNKKSEFEKVNSLYALDIVKMTHLHMMCMTFKIVLNFLDYHEFGCSKVKHHMTNLARVFALNELINDSVPLYETGFLVQGSAPLIMEAMKLLLTELRPQMIPLVESWIFSDYTQVSAIGNSYGDIYM